MPYAEPQDILIGSPLLVNFIEFPKRSSWNDVMPFHQVARSADGSDGHKVNALLQRNVRLSLHDLEWSKPEQHNNHQETYWRPILGVSIISSIQDVSDTAIWSINTIHVVDFRCAFICTSLCILPYIFLYQDKSSLWHQLLPGFGAGTPYSPEEFKRKKNTTRMPQNRWLPLLLLFFIYIILYETLSAVLTMFHICPATNRTWFQGHWLFGFFGQNNWLK